jgi:hypothetical protein
LAARALHYTPELADKIYSAIASGLSLRVIFERRMMPARRTVRGGLAEHPDFARSYFAARAVQADHLVDEILTIADSVRGSDSNAAVQAAKLAGDARKWVAAKMRPETYGEVLALTGREGRDLIPTPDPSKVALLLLNIPHAGSADAGAATESDEA